MIKYYLELKVRIPMPNRDQAHESAKLLTALLTGLGINPNAMEWNSALVEESVIPDVIAGVSDTNAN